MALEIQSIKNKAELFEGGIRSGDFLLEINGHKINDFLDYKFYQTEEKLELVFRKNDQILAFYMEKEYDQDLGLTFYPMSIHRCACNCIFCFVDQTHPNSRKSIKIKDDDFRLSFLQGNFITLTNLRKDDFSRIVEQNLSPLYISVHTTNDALRKKMMKYRNNIRILEKLKYFADNNIQIHTQIVLVPGWNDKDELRKSVFDLAELYPAVRSIGIVPVGLTKFREGLSSIKKVSRTQTERIIERTHRWRKDLMDKYGKGIVSLADEFFLSVGQQVPPQKYYDDFPQLENGIGMTRTLINNWEAAVRAFQIPKNIKSITICTAKLIFPVLKKLAKILEEKGGVRVNVLEVENNYLGKDITVSGLLSAEDIIREINSNTSADLILLPENMFNKDGVTIDGKSLKEIKEATGNAIMHSP